MHRILVVDDDPTIRRLLRVILSLEYLVSEAANGTEALRAMGLERPFDLILVDWMMPTMSGVELIREIRTNGGRLADTPIIMLTAKDGSDAEAMAYEAGADAYLTKPFEPAVLEELVDVMIQASGDDSHVGRKLRHLEGV